MTVRGGEAPGHSSSESQCILSSPSFTARPMELGEAHKPHKAEVKLALEKNWLHVLLFYPVRVTLLKMCARIQGEVPRLVFWCWSCRRTPRVVSETTRAVLS